MTRLTLILTIRPHDAIIINEDKQQSAMSEVDLKSKVGCFLLKSPQVVLGTSRRLEVDLGSLLYQVGSDWHIKVTPRSTYDNRYSKFKEKRLRGAPVLRSQNHDRKLVLKRLQEITIETKTFIVEVAAGDLFQKGRLRMFSCKIWKTKPDTKNLRPGVNNINPKPR